jgi:hypothetical protein
VSAASNGSCHRVDAVDTWISSGLTRTRLSPFALCSHRTLPVSRYCTPSSRPISSGVLAVRRYWLELLDAVTCRPGSAASLPRISSVIPSAK